MKSCSAAVICVVASLGLAPQTAFAYGLNLSAKGHPVRWDVNAVAFRMDPDLQLAFPNGAADSAVAMAFDAWRGLPRVPDLMLRPGLPASAGYHEGEDSNGVYFVRDWQHDDNMLAVTVVTYDANTGEMFDADVLVNGEAALAMLDENSAKQSQAHDLGAVLTHEAGHCLGLDESHTHPEATMWPKVFPGDTHQRQLSEDDEAGVIMNYAGSVPDAPLGCGQASVLGHSSRGNHALLGLFTLCAALWLLRAVSRAGSRKALAFGLAGMVAVVPSFQSDDSSPSNASAQSLASELDRVGNVVDGEAEAKLAHAAHADRSARLSAARLLERAGAPDDRVLAEQLADDADPVVAAHARSALGKLLSRAPRNIEAATTEASRTRLQRAFGASVALDKLMRGKAQRRESKLVDGIITTQYTVRDQAGVESTLEVNGGQANGLIQRFMHEEAPPADGADVVIVPGANGTRRWAYHHDGALFGGSLGQGPAIKL